MFFKKNSCFRCGKKIGSSYSFCPHCGVGLRNMERANEKIVMNFQGAFPPGFGKVIEGFAKKMIKDLQDADPEEINRLANQLMGGAFEQNSLQNEPKKRVVKKIRRISKDDAERYSRLPREEARTSVRRLAQGIVYELSLPDVKNVKDIFVNKLHNSIEVKAFGEKKAYFKLIPIDMAIKRSAFNSGKLILELKE